jgi:hypothetical protein
MEKSTTNSEETKFKHIIDLVNQYPNDMELGRKIRLFIENQKIETIPINIGDDSHNYGY